MAGRRIGARPHLLANDRFVGLQWRHGAAHEWGFGRKRPSQTDSPNEWFKGAQYQRFPSGEVTLQASFVTPFVVHYADGQPWVWALEILPGYNAVARVKPGSHWQTDVIAGWR